MVSTLDSESSDLSSNLGGNLTKKKNKNKNNIYIYIYNKRGDSHFLI